MHLNLYSIVILNTIFAVSTGNMATASKESKTLYCPGGGEELDHAKITFEDNASSKMGTMTMQFFSEHSAGKKFMDPHLFDSSWSKLLQGKEEVVFVMSESADRSNPAILRKTAILHLEPKRGRGLWGGFISADGTVYHVDDCSTSEKIVALARANQKK